MESLHIRLKTEEAINAKRDILYTEASLLNLIKRIQKYREIKSLEFKTKILLKTRLKKLIEEIVTLKKQLPKTKKPGAGEAGENLGKITEGRLEIELQEIKEKLEKLE